VTCCQVRGAPAIAVVGVLSLVAEIYNHDFASANELHELVELKLSHLVTARPTAVNLANARHALLQRLDQWTRDTTITADELKRR